MAPNLKWPRNGRRNRKMDLKMGCWPFFISATIFGNFGPGAMMIFHFLPVFPGFLRQALFFSHSVNGHFDRNTRPDSKVLLKELICA